MTQNDNDNKAIGRYVFPLLREPDNERSFAGTAFLIDGYLVTAGHVIDHNKTYYLYTGGHNYHSRYEWAALDAMNDSVALIVEIIKQWAN